MMRRFIKLMMFVSVVFVLIFSVAISCKPSKNICTKTANDTIFVETIRIDTIKIIDRNKSDSLAKCLIGARDSIKLYRDSISYQDYINARRIEKIRYYISICEKRPKNKKFFYGWIKRTMTDN